MGPLYFAIIIVFIAYKLPERKKRKKTIKNQSEILSWVSLIKKEFRLLKFYKRRRFFIANLLQ